MIVHKLTISVTMDVSPFAWCLARAVLNTYGVILSKNCAVNSEWYMGFICPHELWGSKERLKLYNRMLKHCIYN